MMGTRFEDNRRALNGFTSAAKADSSRRIGTAEAVLFHKLVLGADRGFTGEPL